MQPLGTTAAPARQHEPRRASHHDRAHMRGGLRADRLSHARRRGDRGRLPHRRGSRARLRRGRGPARSPPLGVPAVLQRAANAPGRPRAALLRAVRAAGRARVGHQLGSAVGVCPRRHTPSAARHLLQRPHAVAKPGSRSTASRTGGDSASARGPLLGLAIQRSAGSFWRSFFAEFFPRTPIRPAAGASLEHEAERRAGSRVAALGATTSL